MIQAHFCQENCPRFLGNKGHFSELQKKKKDLSIISAPLYQSFMKNLNVFHFSAALSKKFGEK